MEATGELGAVFRELDYLDDGYEDGSVSHVGLRRIILESPELEAQIGSTLTKALLDRAESNIYGQITFAELVSVYHGMIQHALFRHEDNPSLQRGSSKHRHKMTSAAVKLAIPYSERDSKLSYLEEYSCIPPPIFMFVISGVQIGIFIWHVLLQSKNGIVVGPDGPPYLDGVLIFNPKKKKEAWRFLSYMLVHSGYFHLLFNVLVQLTLGLPLEMVHRWWRVLLIYICGGLAGSLATSLTDPDVYVAGASGGVYALMSAHLANILFNWSEMEFPALRLVSFLLVMAVDLAVAVYYRHNGINTKTAYTAHIGGAVLGLLLGIVVLRNLKVKTWERVVWWMALIITLSLFLVGIIWNSINIVLEK